MKNVFVPGLTELQRAEISTVEIPGGLRLHGLLDYDSLVKADEFDFDELLDRARTELDAFDGTVDAIIAHWDFPTSVIVPILAAERGLPAPSLESVLRSEHKLWSRMLQRESVPECVPDFRAFDPFDANALDSIDLDFPFWVKPVKAHSSQLGFEVHDAEEFAAATETIRAEIGRIADPFDQALARVTVPEDVRVVGGRTCLAEQIVTGTQAAPEGSMAAGEYRVHGVFDMRKDATGHSFAHLDYPARTVPESVRDTMIEVSERYLRHVGYDNGCFNSEFMWDADTGKLWLIEINTRISQSHSDLFVKVDGTSNHAVAIDVALGRTLEMPHRKGRFAVAAQCMVPRYEDGVVTRVPDESQIEALRRRFPDTVVNIDVAPGERLSELPNQDPYRYKLATLYLGAADHDELEQRYQDCLEALPFEFEEVD
ncbi:ATP-grasp domain-containing protein [Nocardia ignorata]|uniref:Carbamoyl-phosphate synthase L subunit-like protein n=1 Tax=Nocardia ignorata TaxID=145285 RepID=A0A4V3CMR9_NOCIG|nr:ATP-grasp domain-containing protein [Nocardia ignorata]TDP31182.1 carbamoyl-phosphate synthase L subunit-like protein [Nocardia ignorata]